MVRITKENNYTIFRDSELKVSNSIAYIRNWNLKNIDKELLEKYKLKQKYYLYVGMTTEKDFKLRTGKWKYDVKYRVDKIEKEVIKFYNRYKKLMLNEYEMSEDDFDKMFFYNSEVSIYKVKDRNKALDCEKKFLNTLFFNQLFNTDYVILNKNDSNCKVLDNNIIELSDNIILNMI